MAQWEIGQIGLGVVGHNFARHLLKANGQLAVYDLDSDKMRALEPDGAEPMTCPKELAARGEVVVMSLPNPAAVEGVLLGADGVLEGARSGTLIIDCSTIDPPTCERMYRAAREHGVSYLEAPISGGEPGGAGQDGVRAANISFMVGGDEAAFERAKPVLAVLGSHNFYLGPAGSGSIVKLISNLIGGINNLVVAEAFVLGSAAGFSPETLLEVFRHTDAKSYMMTEYIAPRIQRRDFEPGFTVDLMYKDHRLAAELAQRLKVPLLFNQLALGVYEIVRARRSGKQGLDGSAQRPG